MMKRIFIALKIEAQENLLKLISSYQVRLNNDQIKWTDTANIHITLAFLGDTEEKTIKEIISMLEVRCKGSGKFELMLKGSGIFRNLDDPRIIWTGIEPSEKLLKLNYLIMNGLKELGVKMENRPYKPHLTIGRIKRLNDAESLKTLIDKFQNYEIQLVPVNEVILYESILLTAGPVYKPLIKVKL
jgi:RNA 2',3'-cyclic 3'-phosphodiesterase